MELGKKIAEIRKEHDLTQEGLAEICSVTRQTISNWENGKSCPDLETLVLISDTFDITLDEMLKGDKKMVSMIAAEQKQGRKYKSSKTIFAVIAAAVVIAGIIFLIELLIAALMAKILHMKYCKAYEWNEYRRQLTASLAHDLKSPLAVISASSSSSGTQ